MPDTSAHDLKKLQVRLSTLEKELKDAQGDRTQANEKVSGVQNKIKGVKSSMEKLKKKKAIVSEHALLRYFERCLGYDLEAIKKGILSGKLPELIDQFNSGKFPQSMPPPTNGRSGETFRVVVKNKVVTTIET